jgi:hypothetical protein
MKRLLLILPLALLLGACSHFYRYYDYAPLEQPVFGGGRLVFEMRGDWEVVSKRPQVTQRGSPYFLRVTFRQAQPPGAKASITIFSIKPTKSSVDFPVSESGVTRQLSISGQAEFSFGYSGLSLDHVPIEVSGRLQVGDDTQDFSVILMPIYKEERRSDLYDGAMGV